MWELGPGSFTWLQGPEKQSHPIVLDGFQQYLPLLAEIHSGFILFGRFEDLGGWTFSVSSSLDEKQHSNPKHTHYSQTLVLIFVLFAPA